jgi:hypothetical protein
MLVVISLLLMPALAELNRLLLPTTLQRASPCDFPSLRFVCAECDPAKEIVGSFVLMNWMLDAWGNRTLLQMCAGAEKARINKENKKANDLKTRSWYLRSIIDHVG